MSERTKQASTCRCAGACSARTGFGAWRIREAFLSDYAHIQSGCETLNLFPPIFDSINLPEDIFSLPFTALSIRSNTTLASW